MTSWWDRYPGRLEEELDAFRDRGLAFERDETLFRDAGRLLLRGSIDHASQQVELEVLYPDLFPYLRPEVFAPGLALPRHQHPVGHNLCLLDRATTSWKPDDTGAWLVAERVPLLLSRLSAGPKAMREAETPQGEPVSVYFDAETLPGTAIFVPASALELPAEPRIGSGRLTFALDMGVQRGVRALLTELVAKPSGKKKTTLLARAEPQLARRFDGPTVQMRWVRLEQPPTAFTADAVLAAADAVQAGFGSPPWQMVSDGEVSVTGVVFEEEVRQEEFEDTWVFAVRCRSRHASGQVGAYVIHGDRMGAEDLGARIPKLAKLPDSTVAQVGLGAIGAPLALELARNQVGHLRLMEPDRLEAAQIVRWPFGMPAVGRFKINWVTGFIEQNYPFTAVDRFIHRLGQTGLDRRARSESELDLLARFLQGVDLVIDASAEIRIQQLLADFGSEYGIRQIFVSATEGARGGHVALVVPGAGGCWFCWKLHTSSNESGSKAIPLPPFDSDGQVQPRGCASPTFTGASFDLLPVVAQAARVAAAAIDRKDARSEVWVCSMPADAIGAPEWSAHPVPVHPRCPCCSADS